MNKHTPGPWKAQSRSMSDQSLVVKAADENYTEICMLRQGAQRHYGDADESDIANARLIASAPELLAAAIAYLDAGIGNIDSRRASLRSAIAKAKGEA